MIVASLHYDKVSDARDNFKALLDAAERGYPATIRRDGQTAAVVSADRLRYFLAKLTSHAEVVSEAGSWWVYIPGLPVSADGASFDGAISEMIDALRDYADDWQDHLSTAPNHSSNWELVQLVSLSTDDQLRDWLCGVD
jgi:antitoxin (DNA-binding transcriptional repressor) of toxin-antitoxin stability system